MLLEVEILVFEQLLRDSVPRNQLAIVSLKLKLPVVPKAQVIKVTTYRAKVLTASAQHLDHNLRRTSDRPGNLLKLRLRQSIATPRPTSRVGSDIEERNTDPNINEPVRHVPDPSSWHSPRATTSRGRAARSRPATWPAARRDQDRQPAHPGSLPGQSGSSSSQSPRVRAIKAPKDGARTYVTLRELERYVASCEGRTTAEHAPR